MNRQLSVVSLSVRAFDTFVSTCENHCVSLILGLLGEGFFHTCNIILQCLVWNECVVAFLVVVYTFFVANIHVLVLYQGHTKISKGDICKIGLMAR